MIRARLENGKALEALLAGLADEFGPRSGGLPPMRAAIRKALKPVLADVRQSTPVQTGALRKTARLSVIAGKRGKPIAYGVVGWSFRRDATARLQQGLAVEFGNRHTTGQAILEGVFRRHQRQMLADFERELPLEITKTLHKLTAKKAGGKLRIR